MNPVLNITPVKTWSWLNVNEMKYDGPLPERAPFNKNPLIEVPEGVSIDNIGDSSSLNLEDEEAFMAEYVRGNRNHGYSIVVPENFKPARPLIIDYVLDADNPVVVDETSIILGKNSSLNIIFRYTGNIPEAFHAGITHIDVGQNANLTLTKVQLLNGEGNDLDYTRIEQGENSSTRTILIETGAKRTVGNWQSNLNGEGSSTSLKAAYIGSKDQVLDFNYRMNHKAKNTRGEILGQGALFDNCRKVLRDTIDFQRGSGGSKSGETENVLLLSDNAENLSVPLLLCVEDDVEGTHASTTGSIDDKALFYIMSRGLSKEQAEKMLIEAALIPIAMEIEHENTREMALEFIQRRLADETNY